MRKCIEFENYVPGKSIEEVKEIYGLERVVKLASNENPYGASPKAIEVVRNFTDLHRYPNPEYRVLREKLAEYTGWDANRIVIGAGIDGILETLFKILIDQGDEVIIPVPTFQYYGILTRLHCAREIRVQRDENFRIPYKIFEYLSNKTKLIILPFPNNPTGNTEDLKLVKELAESTKAIVFVDEAYVEFSDSKVDLDFENIVIARTMSKALGLANLRVGYARLPEWLVKYYRSASTPFPVSTLAERAAIASLEDLEWMKWCVERIKTERERLFKELRGVTQAYPSQANFIFFRSKDWLAEELLKRGVIIRDCKSFGVSGYRVTVGKPDENDFFLEKLKELI
ncbi:MAG: histidinol-phosphate transaminase [Archaeoglobaceae archaeon]